MELKVTQGLLKGRKIILKQVGNDLRPTSTIHRQALFNRFDNNLQGLKFLDLFAGSGIVGIEALSRGADKVYFADSSSDHVTAIKKNLQNMKTDKGFYDVVNIDYLKFLKINTDCFDIVYIDPPFRLLKENKNFIYEIAKNIKSITLSKNGFLIIETPKKYHTNTDLKDYNLIFEQVFGSVKISCWKNIN